MEKLDIITTEYGNFSFKHKTSALHKLGGSAVEYEDGNKEWWVNGARICLNQEENELYDIVESGTYKIYYKKGSNIFHRLDGPAIKTHSRKEWWVYGIRHREDGPALVHMDSVCWYNKGLKHRVDGPTVEFDNGHIEWWLNDAVHRDNGPAIEYPNGCKLWYSKGALHRLDGPAIEYKNKPNQWWVGGIRFSKEKEIIMNLWWENGRV